jgi:hypothetical protein
MIVAVVTCFFASVAVSEEKAKDKKRGDGKGPMFAFVCLESADFPDAKTLESSFAKWFGLPKDKPPKVEIDKDDAPGATVDLGEHSVVIGLIERPVPEDDIKYACFNAHFWRDAWKVMQKHKAHLIVVVIGKFEKRYERAQFLTQAVAACSEAFPTTGIYWGDASTAHSPEFFRKQVKTKIKEVEDLPTLLWIGFLRDNHEDGTVSFYTKGLSDFGCMEMEIVKSKEKPSQVLGLLHDTAQYAIWAGNVIKDGDTIGPDGDTKIKTSYAKSAIDRPGKVIRIEY